MKKLKEKLESYEDVFHPIIIEDRETYNRLLEIAKKGEETPFYNKSKLSIEHDLAWHEMKSKELLDYLFDAKESIWQDKKDKMNRFHKINKFRKKRNMNLKLHWERQW